MSSSTGFETPPPEEEGERMDSEEFPDSLELLLLECELPTTGANFHCSESAYTFHEAGYVGARELDRMLRGQTPTPHLAVRKE